jgi:hypothetical protein
VPQRFTLSPAANPVDRLYRVTEGAGIAPVTLTPVVNPPLISGNECGAPLYDPRLDAALFLWKDCGTPGNVWHLRATAGGSREKITYRGNISSTGRISFTPFSFDGDFAALDPTGTILTYRLGMNLAGEDGIDFSYPSGASACFRLDAPVGARVLIGAGSKPARVPLNLNTLRPC